jgi:hypothetical protein
MKPSSVEDLVDFSSRLLSLLVVPSGISFCAQRGDTTPMYQAGNAELWRASQAIARGACECAWLAMELHMRDIHQG